MSSMRIVVCVKAVPGSTEVKMDPKTNTIVRDGGQAVINPFDASALEAALQIKEGFAGLSVDVGVTVVSMGIPATEELLRDCIARGADDAILLTDRVFAGADTLATAYALKCGIDAIGEPFDMIICGKMAVDGDTAQIGPELAAAYDVRCVTDASLIEGARAGKEGIVIHTTDEGDETVCVPQPAVITVSKDIAQLRMPSIAGLKRAERAEVRVLSAADVGADPTRCGLAGSPTQVVRSFVPERNNTCECIDGTVVEQAAALVKLFEEVA